MEAEWEGRQAKYGIRDGEHGRQAEVTWKAEWGEEQNRGSGGEYGRKTEVIWEAEWKGVREKWGMEGI